MSAQHVSEYRASSLVILYRSMWSSNTNLLSKAWRKRSVTRMVLSLKRPIVNFQHQPMRPVRILSSWDDLRRDPSVPHGIAMWVVADNLRKGAQQMRCKSPSPFMHRVGGRRCQNDICGNSICTVAFPRYKDDDFLDIILPLRWYTS